MIVYLYVFVKVIKKYNNLKKFILIILFIVMIDLTTKLDSNNLSFIKINF